MLVAGVLPAAKSEVGQISKPEGQRIQEQEDRRCLNLISAMCGVQVVDRSEGSNVVVLRNSILDMNSKIGRGAWSVPAPWAGTPSAFVFWHSIQNVKRLDNYGTMMVPLVGVTSRIYWKATKHLIDKPTGGGADPAFEHTEWTAPFIMERRRNEIARRTGRGEGNVLVCCEGGLAALKLDTERGLRYLTDHRIRLALLRRGEVFNWPFAMIGYNGRHPSDTGMVFAIERGTQACAIFHHCTDLYWTKLV